MFMEYLDTSQRKTTHKGEPLGLTPGLKVRME